MNQTINGYTLMQWLGAGGMGEVYQAYHATTQRTVAIKLLRRLEHTERFRNEAAVQASLGHSHIAMVYEFFVDKGLFCLVMEYIDGPTLEQLIRKHTKLPEETAWKLLGQVASALAYLHKHGIVHRDLKAGNIKITKQGQAKLLDFGLARYAHSPKLTSQGHLVGTASSMAPEQFAGESSAASDCWALGVLLYEMVTGYTPFGGSSESEIGRLIRQADYIPPAKLNSDLSRYSSKLIERLLTVAPERRLTAQQVQEVTQNPELLNSVNWLGQVRKWWGKINS